MRSFFPRDVLDEILDSIQSVSEGFASYSNPDRYNLQVVQFSNKNILPPLELKMDVSNIQSNLLMWSPLLRGHLP